MLISYINGCYTDNLVSLQLYDRSFNFADAVYTVLVVNNGVLVDLKHHISSLKESLQHLSIQCDLNELESIITKLLKLNDCNSAKCYIHVSRGQELKKREHWHEDLQDASIYVTLDNWSIKDFPFKLQKISLACVEDKRHNFVYIKSTNMLANIIAKKQACAQKADEALLILGEANSDFYVHEGASCNIFIIKNGCFYTPCTEKIYNGVTRRRIIQLLGDNKEKLIEKPITKKDLLTADTIFTSAAASLINEVDVIYIEGKQVYKSNITDPKLMHLAKLYYDKVINLS